MNCYYFFFFFLRLRPIKALKLLGDTKRGSIEYGVDSIGRGVPLFHINF